MPFIFSLIWHNTCNLAHVKLHKKKRPVPVNTVVRVPTHSRGHPSENDVSYNTLQKALSHQPLTFLHPIRRARQHTSSIGYTGLSCLFRFHAITNTTNVSWNLWKPKSAKRSLQPKYSANTTRFHEPVISMWSRKTWDVNRESTLKHNKIQTIGGRSEGVCVEIKNIKQLEKTSNPSDNKSSINASIPAEI